MEFNVKPLPHFLIIDKDAPNIAVKSLFRVVIPNEIYRDSVEMDHEMFHIKQAWAETIIFGVFGMAITGLLIVLFGVSPLPTGILILSAISVLYRFVFRKNWAVDEAREIAAYGETLRSLKRRGHDGMSLDWHRNFYGSSLADSDLYKNFSSQRLLGGNITVEYLAPIYYDAILQAEQNPQKLYGSFPTDNKD